MELTGQTSETFNPYPHPRSPPVNRSSYLAMAALCAFAVNVNPALAAPQITGEYIESRSCDVYTGPCFANGELGLTGKEALMAWKVDRGSFNGVKLDGLTVALVVEASDTIGQNAGFRNKPETLGSVILVDRNASSDQSAALQAFVRDAAPELATRIRRVETVAMTLENDHLAGHGLFQAGEIAKIETRKIAKGDCVCTNEAIFYPPLTKVQNVQPAYSLESQFEGTGLNTTWSTFNKRSAFLATFRR